MGSKNRSLRFGGVVLIEASDLVEELTSDVIVEPLRWEFLERTREAVENVFA